MSSLPYSPHRSKFKNASKSENRRQILREKALKKTKENRSKIIERLRNSSNINNLDLNTNNNNNNHTNNNHPSYLDQYTSSTDTLANQISDSLFQELTIECHTNQNHSSISSDGTPNENFNNLTEDELIFLRESIKEELERNILELKEMENQEFLRMQEQATMSIDPSLNSFFAGTNNSGFLSVDRSYDNNSGFQQAGQHQQQNENMYPFKFSTNNNNDKNNPIYCPLCKLGKLQEIFGKILCHKCHSVIVDSDKLNLDGLKFQLQMCYENHNRANCLDEMSFVMNNGVLVAKCEICGLYLEIP